MTFSIVARDPVTGAFGVATATGGPAVGSLVPHARAGVGAIATQARTNALFGFDGLDLLEKGEMGAQDVLDHLLSGDAGRERRQVILIDRDGRTAGWTGSACDEHAGDFAGENFAVAGNLLAEIEVLPAMMAGFAAAGDLADRLLAAMVAGQAAGGDRRGATSAALKVFTTEPYPAIDLRVDWSNAPIDDLGRVLAEVRAPGYARFFRTIPTRANPNGQV